MKTAEEILRERKIILDACECETCTKNRGNYIAAMEEYAAQRKPTKEFTDYLQSAKDEFVLTFLEQQPDTQLRVKAENFIIAFEQACVR